MRGGVGGKYDGAMVLERLNHPASLMLNNWIQYDRPFYAERYLFGVWVLLHTTPSLLSCFELKAYMPYLSTQQLPFSPYGVHLS